MNNFITFAYELFPGNMFLCFSHKIARIIAIKNGATNISDISGSLHGLNMELPTYSF